LAIKWFFPEIGKVADLTVVDPSQKSTSWKTRHRDVKVMGATMKRVLPRAFGSF